MRLVVQLFTFCILFFGNCWAVDVFVTSICEQKLSLRNLNELNVYKSVLISGDRGHLKRCLKALSKSEVSWQKVTANYLLAYRYREARTYLSSPEVLEVEVLRDVSTGLYSRRTGQKLVAELKSLVSPVELVLRFAGTIEGYTRLIPLGVKFFVDHNDISPILTLLRGIPSYLIKTKHQAIADSIDNSSPNRGLVALLKSYIYHEIGDYEKTMTNLETLDRFGQGLPQLFDEKAFRARYKLRKARDWVPTRKYWELLTDYCKTAKEEEQVVKSIYKAAIGAQFNTLKTCLRNGSSTSTALSRVSKEISSGSLEDALKAVPSKDWRLKSAINLYIQSVLDPKSKELAQGLLKRNIGQVKVDGFHTPVAVGMMDHLIPAGRASYAVSVLHEVEKFKKYSARLHNLYGYYYVKIKSYDKALERYEKARRLDANLELLHSLKDVKALLYKAKKEKAKKVPKARSTANAKSKSNSSKVSSSQPTLQGIQAQYHIALKKYQSAKNPQEKKKAMSEMKALDAQYAKLKGQSTPAKTKKKSPVVFKDKAGIDKYYGERLAELSAALIKSTSSEQSKQIAKHIESTKKEHTLKLSQLAAMQKNNASKKAGEAESCHKCKVKLNANAKFCHQCGTSTQQKVNCSKCNKSWPADHKFCQSCGNKL